MTEGYISSRESVEVKFPFVDPTRLVRDGSVGCVDGYTKILCMVGVIACCCELDTLRHVNIILLVEMAIDEFNNICFN